jgi:hypothetical protein
MQFVRNNWLPLIIIVLGFCASLAIALAPLQFLLNNTIPDDSFYYFQIARNISHGLGSTFDGINPTNGYHPLWLAILVPIYHFFSNGSVMDIAPIHAALVLSASFNLALGFVLIALLSRHTDNILIKAAALGVWFFNPYNLYSMSNGLESALSILLIASFLLVALRFGERRSIGRLFVVGVVGGLMMLARLDNLFYFVMFLLWLMYDQAFMPSLRNVFFVGIVATIVVSPWLIFNYFTFGMILTSASAAYTIVNHRIIYQDNGYSLFQTFKAAIYMTDYSLRTFVWPETGAPSVFLTFFGIAAGYLIFTEGKLRLFAREIPLELFIFGGGVLVFIVNASIRWSPREWYFVPLNFFIALGIAWLAEKMRERGVLNVRVAAVASLMVGFIFFINWHKYLQNNYYTSVPVLQSTLYANDAVPKGEQIGAFNAGIVGYFSTHPVINLDGLVNNSAYIAIRDQDEWSYIGSLHLEYLLDDGKRVQYRMRTSLGIPYVLEKLEPIHETAEGPTLYRIK